ncbi:MAG TPA: dTMP kinase [Gemmataceae bacterium]|nr:dTMP kinase [Gemmataceae bacterium]
MQHGLLFSLDGLDGTGKSTQCRLLAEWLRSQGHSVTPCKDPGGTQAGDVIRSLLLDHRGDLNVACEALLFMASRAQLVAEVIKPALAAGNMVVCDRFVLANVVYQGHAGGLDPAWLWQWGRFSSDGLEPDLTIVLDLPAEMARQRKGGPTDRMERRDHEFHERVRAGFLAEAARQPDAIRVIDANASVDAVQERIRQEVSRVLAANLGA